MLNYMHFIVMIQMFQLEKIRNLKCTRRSRSHRGIWWFKLVGRTTQEANDYASKNGLVGFSFSSPNLSLAKAQEPYWAGCVSVDDPTLAWHERIDMPLFSWSSQARGFFTGRFTQEDRSNEDLVRVFYNDENWERYRRAEQLAKRKRR